MDKVSIIIPVYNAAKTINRCVSSLINQSYSYIEIILIDDGSKDNSLLLCNELSMKDKRVKVIHQDNLGVSAARNKGIQEATGKWVMFVDSDDWIEQNTVQCMVELVQNDEDILGVYSFVNEYTDTSIAMKIEDGNYTVGELISRFERIRNIEAILCSVCNKIYYRSSIVKNNIRFESGIKFGEDFIFNSRVMKFTKKIIATSFGLYHYDCTSPNSGVKTLYRQYDTYIYSMDDALCSLLKSLKIDQEISNRFREFFITNQWKYAFYICMNSKCSLRTQQKIIINWATNVPMEMRQWESILQSDIAKFLEKDSSGNLLSQNISKYLMKCKLNKIKRELVIKIKQFIRRGIKK